MIKKFIRYGKILISVSLIFVLMSTSYASLSAADGSTFVSKSEFDSALVDFNSRLTTFEAGINSKIDSQVTSYLDRNGIWSGKKQTLTSNDIYFAQCVSNYNNRLNGAYYFPVVATDNSNLSCVKSYNVGAFTSANGIYNYIAPEDESAILVEEIDKNGMLILDFNWRTLYYADNKVPATSIENIKNGAGGRDGVNSVFWAKSYFADLAAGKVKDLTTYENPNVNWSGFYFACSQSGSSWENLTFRHDLKIDVVDRANEERVGAVENIGNVVIQASSKGQHQRASDGIGDTTMWAAPWSDPRGRKVVKFFVAKGEKIKVVSHIGKTGWSEDTFKSRQMSAMMWSFMQVNDLQVY